MTTATTDIHDKLSYNAHGNKRPSNIHAIIAMVTHCLQLAAAAQ